MSVWEMDNSHRQGNHDAGLSISISVEIEATVLTTLLCTHDEKDPLSTRTMSDIRLSVCAGVGLRHAQASGLVHAQLLVAMRAW